jgi:hypothetical protein
VTSCRQKPGCDLSLPVLPGPSVDIIEGTGRVRRARLRPAVPRRAYRLRADTARLRPPAVSRSLRAAPVLSRP